MTRLVRASGEKPLFWVASSREDLQQFPEPVKDAIGVALSVAQFGGKGEGPGVLEVVEDYRGGTYRAVYTVRFVEAIYVLYVFQKKSPSGIRTSQKDVRLISQRLQAARVEYEARHAQERHAKEQR